jgi:hypothetical protein
LAGAGLPESTSLPQIGAAITAALSQLGRNGLPMYVLMGLPENLHSKSRVNPCIHYDALQHFPPSRSCIFRGVF